MRKTLFILMTGCLFQALSTSPLATTYYADPSNTTNCPCAYPNVNGTGSCGTMGNPFSCISDGLKKSVAGDVVSAANGTYKECLNIVSPTNQGVSVLAQNSRQATIMPNPLHPSCQAPYTAVVWSAANAVVSGFKVTGSPAFGVFFTGSNNQMLDVEVYGNGTGIRVDGAGTAIRDSEIHDNGGAALEVYAPDGELTRVTIQANAGTGVILRAGSDRSRLSDVTIRDNGGYGIYLRSNDNILTNTIVLRSGPARTEGNIYDASNGIRLMGSRNTITGGEIAEGRQGIMVICEVPADCGLQPPDACPPCSPSTPAANIISGVNIHDNNPFDGIKLDNSCDTTITNSHIHHNNGMGIFESACVRGTVIEFSEIDNQRGPVNTSHGLYLEGLNGQVRANKVHHNGYYGIHLWNAPQGEGTERYIVERNESYANLHGMVLGGPDLGGRYPKNVEIRYNLIHHNRFLGFKYLNGSCNGSDSGNSFHHNTIYKDGVEIWLADANNFTFKNNIIIGEDGLAFPDDHILRVVQSNIDPNAFDGNVYYASGTTPDTPSILWNAAHDNCNCGECLSLNQVKAGVIQGLGANGECLNPPRDCGGPPPAGATSVMETHAQWTPVSFVDPTTGSWTQPYAGHPVGGRPGDFHLRVGSAGICGGVCVSSTGALDLDGDAVVSCNRPGCNPPSDGVGTDYYRDTDLDGTADRYDCSPSSAGDATICDYPTPDPQSDETACTNHPVTPYPGAPYDPAVYPGLPEAPEICDGKDNNCDGAYLSGGETDNDKDGFFNSSLCPQTLRDCNDSDDLIYPGAAEICDGKYNGCNDLQCTCIVPLNEADDDEDTTPNCADPTFDATTQANGTVGTITGTIADINGSQGADDVYEAIQEGGSGSKRKLVKVWTFPKIPTGKIYELRLEGYRDGVVGDDAFNFSVSTRSSGDCLSTDGVGPTKLTISNTSDTDLLQTASLGTITNPVVCVRVQDSLQNNDTFPNTLFIDRLSLFQLPACADADGDGYTPSCSGCNNTFCPQTDCNDSSAQANPRGVENLQTGITCLDGLDNNCNGQTDAQDSGCIAEAVAAADQATGPGQIISGTFLDTQAPDETPTVRREVLQETVSGNTSKLQHTWRFDNIPLGSTHKLHYEGFRPNNSENDNFQFYWSTSPTGTFTNVIAGALVNQATEVSGGIDSATFGPANFSGTLYIQVRDTNQGANKKNLDSVSIDHLSIKTVP